MRYPHMMKNVLYLYNKTKPKLKNRIARSFRVLGHVPLVTPWTTAQRAPLSMGFSRQEHWGGSPRPSPGSSRPGTEAESLLCARRRIPCLEPGPDERASHCTGAAQQSVTMAVPMPACRQRMSAPAALQSRDFDYFLTFKIL